MATRFTTDFAPPTNDDEFEDMLRDIYVRMNGVIRERRDMAEVDRNSTMLMYTANQRTSMVIIMQLSAN